MEHFLLFVIHIYQYSLSVIELNSYRKIFINIMEETVTLL